MFYKKSLLATAVVASAMATTAVAAPYVADARSNGMGNTGVVSADFLTSAFHNPALGALYRSNDDVGILIPAVGVNVRDSDDSIKTIEDSQDLYNSIKNTIPSQSDVDKLDALMNDLDGNAPMNVTAGAGIAVAIPMEMVSLNFFASGFTEIIALAQIAPSTGSSATDVQKRYEDSEVAMAAFGTYEYGLAFSKTFSISGQDVAFGVSPKFQKLFTYSAQDKIEDFELDNYEDSEVSKNAFNLDLGVAWVKDSWRAGLVVKDVLAQEVEAKQYNASYKLSPQVTVGGGYVGELITASVDLDLTAQERFDNTDKDDTQFARFGIEGNAWNWAQLRAGYEIDMKSNVDNAFTFGLGISPGDVVSLDLAGSYAGDNQFGASANLAITF
ncbi:conjugal transfer protein TraF [Vibrio sp. SCSIO 43136]|uniref:conjugal transfer protein TraF n=1 Tax=Vibrio sp. SCSIO 43136 TaxID=2819101 RepID=UPI0020766460|nr:conjugal transfer protein TraF [Vibrio sp. SCSIO 43136]USD67606.1 conjugal transfer protein TraF [Vibrio sp. SCSIO 43136]